MNLRLRNSLLLALMLAAAGAAFVLRPGHKAVRQGPAMELQSMIPTSFGTWSMLPVGIVSVVNPQQQEVLDRIYSQLLVRAYRDAASGHVVMLSIAYGEEQSKQSQLHHPEVCYPAQGFQIVEAVKDKLATAAGPIPVNRLVALTGARQEPVTYWMRIGDRIVGGAYEQKVAIVKEGLAGRIADGMLFRVSSLGRDKATEYQVHDSFVNDLLEAIPPGDRQRLVGEGASS